MGTKLSISKACIEDGGGVIGLVGLLIGIAIYFIWIVLYVQCILSMMASTSTRSDQSLLLARLVFSHSVTLPSPNGYLKL
jgi:hypothetical protein